MAYVLEGKREMSFTGQDGKIISGVQLHLVQQFSVNSADIKGRLVEKEFVSANKPCYALAEQIPIGSIISVVYNKRGKVDDLVLVESPSDNPKSK